ncbi:ABC transporter permease, partial [Klebsiella pneumoniae]
PPPPPPPPPPTQTTNKNPPPPAPPPPPPGRGGWAPPPARRPLGGVILSANLRQFTPLAGQSYLMDAIAAVFIGTAFTRLGRVSILGTLGGVLFLAIIDNGLNLMGLNYLVKDALVGVILVVALALSFWQARLRQTHR